MKKIILILCIVVIALAACSCVKTPVNTTFDEVESNGGIAAKQGEWTYFINGSMPEFVSDALDTSTHKKIGFFRCILPLLVLLVLLQEYFSKKDFCEKQKFLFHRLF